ncbi:hypothetical protein GBA52_018210 [Prunus armeniaca]|nr:hypothetical protein GBA52_018210 [Prunus armeniaca]
MAASLISNVDGSLDASLIESSRKKRRKIGAVESDQNPTTNTGARWRSETETTDLLHEARGGAPSGSPEIVAGGEGLRRRQGTEGGGGPSSGGGGQGQDSVEQSDFKNSTQIEPEASQT